MFIFIIYIYQLVKFAICIVGSATWRVIALRMCDRQKESRDVIMLSVIFMNRWVISVFGMLSLSTEKWNFRIPAV